MTITRDARAFRLWLGSPQGILIGLPLLVALTGLVMIAVGRAHMRITVRSMAEARFTDHASATTGRIESLILHVDTTLTEWDSALAHDDYQPTDSLIQRTGKALLASHPGLAYLSLAREDGSHAGVYVAQDGSIVATALPAGAGERRRSKTLLTGPLAGATTATETTAVDTRRQPWYQHAVESADRIWTEPYPFADVDREGITCAQPAMLDGALVGVVTAACYLDTIAEHLATLHLLPGQTVVVFTDAGEVIASTDHGSAMEAYLAHLLDHPEEIRATGSALMQLEGERYLSRLDHVPVGQQQWHIASLAPLSALADPATTASVEQITTMLVALVVATGIGLLFARNLVSVRRALLQARAAARSAQEEVRELGSYQLIRLIAQGGMGEVWQARHKLLARPAAVKLMRLDKTGPGHSMDSMIVRFKREAQALACLTSPNTVHIYDYGVADDGSLYYAMELLTGLDLEQVVERSGPLPPERVVHVLLGCCRSLGEAHHHGLVHRDMKPENVFLARMGDQCDVVKVLDFGIAHVRSAIEEEAESRRHTKRGFAYGTPEYMSPEQAAGETDIDSRADIYALGCLAWFLLVGDPPFASKRPMDVLMSQVNDTAPAMPDERQVPEALAAIVMRCLAKHPDDRYDSARHLLEALEALIPDVVPAWKEEFCSHWWARHAHDVRSLSTEGGQDGTNRLTKRVHT